MEMELKYMDNVYKWKGNVPHTIVTCGPILPHMKDKSISLNNKDFFILHMNI